MSNIVKDIIKRAYDYAGATIGDSDDEFVFDILERAGIIERDYTNRDGKVVYFLRDEAYQYLPTDFIDEMYAERQAEIAKFMERLKGNKDAD